MKNSLTYRIWLLASDARTEIDELLDQLEEAEYGPASDDIYELEFAADILDEKAKVLKLRAFELRRAADGGKLPLPETPTAPEGATDKAGGGEKHESLAADPLLQEAKDWSVKKGRVSVVHLQRMMRVGYTRAARLVDLMIEEGFCSRERDESGFRQIINAASSPTPHR